MNSIYKCLRWRCGDVLPRRRCDCVAWLCVRSSTAVPGVFTRADDNDIQTPVMPMSQIARRGGQRTHTSWPSSESAISSTMGASILHGPHHGAQKSTRTGSGFSKTRDLKFASVASIAACVLAFSERSRGKPDLGASHEQKQGLTQMIRDASQRTLQLAASEPLMDAAGSSVARAITA
jgi:hypothetical protein